MQPLKTALTLSTLLLLVATLAGGTATEPKLVEGALSSSSGKIAFVSDRDANPEIYVMDADGANLIRMTNDPGSDGNPDWSPRANQLAFSSDRNGTNEIYVMNANFAGATNLTNNPASDGGPAWSPDGSKIAFHSDRDGNAEIYAMNADGTGVVRLTNDPAPDTMPSWSPDGSKIAFSKYRDDPPFAEIYVMNADGSGQTRLTHGQQTNSSSPSWSPDGSKIVFMTDRDHVGDGFINWEIYVMNADGNAQTRLTTDPDADTEPDWSSDGSSIVFSKRDHEAPEVSDLYIMKADGTGQRRLTHTPGFDEEPDWAPEPVLATGTISIEHGRARPNGLGTVELRVHDVTEPGLGAWTIGIHFDDALLWGAYSCETPADLISVCEPHFSKGTARVAGADAFGPTGDFTLAEFTFRCLEEEGATELRLEPIVFQDATIGNLQPIDVTLVDGSFECTYDAPSLFLSSSDFRLFANETVTITARAWNNEEGIPLAGLECMFTIKSTGQYDGLPGGSLEPTIEPGPVTTDANGVATAVLATGNTASFIGLLVECDDLSATLALEVLREGLVLPRTGFAQPSQQDSARLWWLGALCALAAGAFFVGGTVLAIGPGRAMFMSKKLVDHVALSRLREGTPMWPRRRGRRGRR